MIRFERYNNRSNFSFHAQPPPHVHERFAKFVHAGASTVPPEGIARLYIDKLGRVRAEKQRPQATVLAELEVQYFIHLRVNQPCVYKQSISKEVFPRRGA